jgi:hypothetical protein
LVPGATASTQMICLTSVAIEPAIGASAIRPENREIVGRRYCLDERLGWLAPIAAPPPDTRPLTLANPPQASAWSQPGGPGTSLSRRALSLKSTCPDPPIGAGANCRAIRGLVGSAIRRICVSRSGRPFICMHSEPGLSHRCPT